MTTTDTSITDDDRIVVDAGYKPQLLRSLGFFSSFAVMFSSLSILMGVFASFGFVLSKAGAFGFWTWPIVGCGQVLVALVFSELAGRIPLTGAIYNWNSKLSNRIVGWISAWIVLFMYLTAAVGIVSSIFSPLQTMIGHELNRLSIYVIGIGIILVQMLINTYGVRLASHINKIAVIAEIVAIIGFSIVLLVVVMSDHKARVDLLTVMPQEPKPYWSAFMLASLMPAWTLLGFEFPIDLSEETLNVQRVVPKAILSAVLLSVFLGFFFLVVLALAIPDLDRVAAASDPISVIMAYHLGAMATKIFLLVVLTAMFAFTMLQMAVTSRVLFAIARDRRIAGSGALAKISSHKVPAAATLLVALAEIVVFITAKDAVDLFAASSVLFCVVYLITVTSFALSIKKLPPPQSFSLGYWRWPVVGATLIWLVAEIAILTLPEEFHNAALIAGTILGLGIFLCSVGFLRRNFLASSSSLKDI